MPRVSSAALLLVLLLTACQSAYYNVLEKGGIHKRDLFVERIEDVRDAQVDGQKQFRSALEQFQYTVNFRGGELEEAYQRLNAEYEASEKAADRIRSRITAVESVSKALFKEWEKELRLYTNDSLRRQSKGQLDDTRKHYKELLAIMKKAEQSLVPVLNTLRDNTLYLKHNLNAQAITALQNEFGNVSNDINRLIHDMEEAIAASNRFIAEFNRQRP